MKYFFVLGRNPKLSRQEILSYLQARRIPFKEILFKENILLLQAPIKPDIKELGGTLKIGSISFQGTFDKFKKYLSEREIIESDKFTYGVIGNLPPSLLKEKFSKERKKAMLKHGSKKIKFINKRISRILKAEYELFLWKKNDEIFFGIVDQKCDYDSLEKRDMNKPVKRSELAISPRLAKILVNLSGAKENQTLMDPFCGIGAILQEALLKNIKVVGIDKDPEAIKGAERNIKWLEKTEGRKFSYKLINQNIKTLKIPKVDAVATECPFGKTLRKKPKKREAQKYIEAFEKRIFPLLRRIQTLKKQDSLIALTFPKLLDYSVSRENIRKHGIKIVAGPFVDFKPGQIVKREIYVLK